MRIAENTFRTAAFFVVMCLLIQLMPPQEVSAAQITEINGKTFTNSNITSVNIGTAVRNISSDAFSNLHSLRKITVSSNNEKYSSYDDCLYDKDKTELICIPQGRSGAGIPNSVTKIAPGALEGMSPDFKKKVCDVIENNADHAKVASDESSDESTDESNDNRDDSVIISCSDTPLGNKVRQILGDLGADKMTKEAALRACYDYLMKACSYKRFTDVFDNNWTNTYAMDILSTGQGNCSSYAAALAFLAKGLGYESRVATGSIDNTSGLPTSHAWTEILIDDRWFIFDAEMDQAKANKEYYKKTYSNYPSTGLKKDLEWRCEF